MTMAMKSNENSRFTDLRDEPIDHLLSPIKGYQDKPLVSLTEAIQPISSFFNEIEDYVFVALHNCQNPVDDLTQQESATIYLYTMQFQGGASLYILLNESLRAENREQLIPWFSFLKLFLTALYKLPSQSRTVWRGVKNVDLSSQYKKGTKFAWWGVSSCTTDIDVLNSNIFLGTDGLRTLFSIECMSGKSVANHSYFKNTEKEIILIPGSYFEVIGQLNPALDLYIIQLKEIVPPITLVKPPFNKSPSVISKPISNVLSKEFPSKSNNKSKQCGILIAGGNGWGNKLNQLQNPMGICIDDDDQTIYIADSTNNRILEWKSSENNGRIIAGGNERGNKTNQLNRPRNVIIDKENNSLIITDTDNRRVMRWSRQNNINNGEIMISNIDCVGLTMDKDGSLYVSDCKKNEVRRWKKGEKTGTIIAGGNGIGDNLKQLDGPTFIFVDEDYSLYISDHFNHRVMKWTKDATEGIIVAGGNGEGNKLTQLCCPQGIIVGQVGRIYIADSGNDRIMCWLNGAGVGSVIVGGNGKGEGLNQLNQPTSLSFDGQDDLYVVDSLNHRIQKFESE